MNSSWRKIDLGCGRAKQVDFIGIDRFVMDGVDVIADLDVGLPLQTDSVDLVYCSHSLEHVRDLMSTMREIYRVCRHGAQVCIVAPYAEQKLNLANPYHFAVFNEHTPRFWTTAPDTFLDETEYMHPHVDHWGLSESDHSNPRIDIRLVRMEFFYFPEYQNLSEEVQRMFRKHQLDVCDQIMYHLIVWKEEQAVGSCFSNHVAAFVPYEPDYVLGRRKPDVVVGSEIMNYDHATNTIALEMLSTIYRENRELRRSLDDLENIKTRVSLLRVELEAKNGLLQWHECREKITDMELSRLKEQLVEAQAAKTLYNKGRQVVSDSYKQLIAHRESRIGRLATFFRGKDTLWADVSPAFYEIRMFTEQHFWRPGRCRLVLGADLAALQYREYIIPFRVDSLTKISLAISPLWPTAQGVAGIEIISEDLRVVAHTTLPLSDISPDTPTHFILPAPVINLGERWALRVFAINADVPVAIYELVNYSVLRRRIRHAPFAFLQ